VVTRANTVVVPVNTTGGGSGFRLEGHRGTDGALLWTQTSDYIDTTVFAPALTPQNRVYFPGAGGTVYYCDNPDDPGATTTGRLAFYGIANHEPGLDSTVFINTPLTTDRQGTIYFGFEVTGANSLNLEGGIARMDKYGNGSWISASAAAGDPTITRVALDCAPALSNDSRTLYVTVNNHAGVGYLVALNTATLQPLAHVKLYDPNSGSAATVSDGSSATPTVGTDGDVYYGVLETPVGSNQYRGWMLHFSSDLSQNKLPGAFGWDTTGSIVPSDLVPSYTGNSSYLLLTKYNKYLQNIYQIGLLDPNASMVDPWTGVTVMREVQTVDGPTPGREWCINDAVVDPSSGSVLANSEDGNLYRWDLASNVLTQRMALDMGIGEAYTPTLIGVDGTVYSISDGTLFAIQASPEQATPLLSLSSVPLSPVMPAETPAGLDLLGPIAGSTAPWTAGMTNAFGISTSKENLPDCRVTPPRGPAHGAFEHEAVDVLGNWASKDDGSDDYEPASYLALARSSQISAWMR
jgi:hypothetical protein